MQRVLLAILGLSVLVGQAMSEEQSTGVQFTYEDSTNGHGFFSSNNKVIAHGAHADPLVTSRLAEMYLKKTSHGSGSIERESIIISNESNQYQVYPAMIYAFGLVAVADDHSMVYAPQTVPIGRGYYATHPLNFISLLNDKTQIKNYASKTCMGQEINYAHGINMDQIATAEDDYLDTGVAKSLGKTLMNFEGDVTDGIAQLEVQQGGIRKWSNPDIDIYEVHSGTFNFATNMNLTVQLYKSLDKDKPWLSCCIGGEEYMSSCDKEALGGDAEGVFDCIYPEGLNNGLIPEEG